MLDILSRDDKTYPETVEAARKAAEHLKQALEPKILGRELPAMTCNCGAVHSGRAKAVKVLPAGREFQYRNQIASWYLWNVEMEEIGGSGHGYTIGLTSFLPKNEIEDLFAEHFKDVDTDYLNQEKHGQELRPKGSKINIAEDRALIEQGRSTLAFHVEHNSRFPEVVELRAKARENELYLALIGAIHSAKGGDVISVPEDEMRVFAHRYMVFAQVGTYLLVECGDTVSLRGITQNVRRRVGADLVSPASIPTRQIRTTLLGNEQTGKHFWIQIDGENVFFDYDKTALNAFGLTLGSLESNRKCDEKMRSLMGKELTFVVEGSSTQGLNVVNILEADA